jgi:hypothetical protein
VSWGALSLGFALSAVVVGVVGRKWLSATWPGVIFLFTLAIVAGLVELFDQIHHG